jgi:hypothetical protein
MQKNQGKEGRLTKGSGWPELPRNVIVDDGRAVEAIGSRGQAAAEGLGVSWSCRLVGGVPAEVTRALGQPETGRRRGNWGGGTAHRRRFLRELPTMQRLGVELRGSGSFQVTR